MVTGLTLQTGSVALRVLAVIPHVGLVTAWIIVAVRTFHGSVIRGTLFVAPKAIA